MRPGAACAPCSPGEQLSGNISGNLSGLLGTPHRLLPAASSKHFTLNSAPASLSLDPAIQNPVLRAWASARSHYLHKIAKEQPGCLGAPRLACPISPLGFQHGQEHQWCQGRRSQSTRQVILFNSPRSGPVQWTPAGIMGVGGCRQGGSPMPLPSCCTSGVINQPSLPPGEAVITVPFIPAPPGTRPQACSFCSVITS